MSLLDILGGIGHAIDTPGAYTRGVLAGSPGRRASGREALHLGPNKPGLDTGDVLGFLAEVILDPLNLIPFGGLAKVLKAAGKAKKFNAGVTKAIEAGAMPAEMAARTKILDDAGRPMRLLHGTPYGHPSSFADSLRPDFSKLSDNALYGKGFYLTEDVIQPTAAAKKARLAGERGIITGGIFNPHSGTYFKKGYIHKGEHVAPSFGPGVDLRHPYYAQTIEDIRVASEGWRKAVESQIKASMSQVNSSTLTASQRHMHESDIRELVYSLRHHDATIRRMFSERSLAHTDADKILDTIVGTMWPPATSRNEIANEFSRRAVQVVDAAKKNRGTAPYNVRMHHVFSEKPFDINARYPLREFEQHIHPDQMQRLMSKDSRVVHMTRAAEAYNKAAARGKAALGYYSPGGGPPEATRDAFEYLMHTLGYKLQKSGYYGYFFSPPAGMLVQKKSRYPGGLIGAAAASRLPPERQRKLLQFFTDEAERKARSVERTSVNYPATASGHDVWHALNRKGHNPYRDDLPGANDILQSMGYDAIRHVGGLGNLEHNVVIALRPEQVFGPWVAQPPRAVPKVSPLRLALGASPQLPARYGSQYSQREPQP